MFQSRYGKIDEFGWWDLEISSAVQRKMPNLRSSFEVSSSGTSGNEQKSRSDMDNVAYNCTLTYGTC